MGRMKMKRDMEANIISIDEQDQFLEEVKSLTEKETTGPETKNGIIVNSVFVKVRKEPNFESDVLEILPKGDKIRIIDSLDNFYKVETPSKKIAYICSDFVEEE